MLTKVEYHQQRLDEITKEIERANMEGEMLQIDLNNARNRGELPVLGMVAVSKSIINALSLIDRSISCWKASSGHDRKPLPLC